MLSFLLPPNDSPPFIQGTGWRVLLDDVCVCVNATRLEMDVVCIHLGLEQKGSVHDIHTHTQLSLSKDTCLV